MVIGFILHSQLLRYQFLRRQWEYFITYKKTNLLMTEIVTDHSRGGGDGLCVQKGNRLELLPERDSKWVECGML